MIIDEFGVFFDDDAASGSMTSRALPFMPYTGRGEPIIVSFLAKGTNPSAVTYTVSVQQSEDDAAFTTVGSFTISKPDTTPVLKAIRLPEGVWLRYVRLSIAATGPVSGTVFAAITRDHFAPYDEGQYIDAGRVVA